MKKLMIAAAAAAMIGGAYADVAAYKLSMTLKTTAPKATEKKTGKDDSGSDVWSCTYYKAQKTIKFAGVLWGEIDEVATELPSDCSLTWDTTTKAQLESDLDLTYNRYDKKGDKVEANGVFTGAPLVEGAAYSDYEINLAGFGSCYLKTVKDECGVASCASYIKTISGNAAGCMTFEEPEGKCTTCEAVEYDCELASEMASAVSGTWKVSYDSSTTKKVKKNIDAGASMGDAINGAYKLPNYVINIEEAE